MVAKAGTNSRVCSSSAMSGHSSHAGPSAAKTDPNPMQLHKSIGRIRYGTPMSPTPRFALALMLGLLTPVAAGRIAQAAEPIADLPSGTYRVETAPGGAVNVAISFDRTGYGVIAPGRIIPATATTPMYRIETLADARGTTIVAAARLASQIDSEITEWQITSAVAAAAVSADDNLSYSCAGEAANAEALTLVYYQNERKGRQIRHVTAGLQLDRKTGRLELAKRTTFNCKATEAPL